MSHELPSNQQPNPDNNPLRPIIEKVWRPVTELRGALQQSLGRKDYDFAGQLLPLVDTELEEARQREELTVAVLLIRTEPEEQRRQYLGALTSVLEEKYSADPQSLEYLRKQTIPALERAFGLTHPKEIFPPGPI